MKKCSACKAVKSFDGFMKSNKYKDGHHCHCRSCHSQKSKKWRAENPAKARAAVKRWEQANPEKVKDKNKRRKGNQERLIRIRCKKYGITRERFEEIVRNQKGLCGICESLMTTVCVDHDHITGQVRGALCRNCNSGIGKLKDSTEIIKKALGYLEKFGEFAKLNFPDSVNTQTLTNES